MKAEAETADLHGAINLLIEAESKYKGYVAKAVDGGAEPPTERGIQLGEDSLVEHTFSLCCARNTALHQLEMKLFKNASAPTLYKEISLTQWGMPGSAKPREN